MYMQDRSLDACSQRNSDYPFGCPARPGDFESDGQSAGQATQRGDQFEALGQLLSVAQEIVFAMTEMSGKPVAGDLRSQAQCIELDYNDVHLK